MLTVEQLLASSSLFSGLGQRELVALARTAQRLEYRPEEVVIQMNSLGDGLYLIASGRVKVVVPSPEGKEVILATLGPGAFFGEMSLLDDEPRSASVVAQLPSVVYRIYRQDFARLLDTSPSIARALLRELSRRLRRANEHMESLVSMDVLGRLARYLMQLAREHGEALGNGWVAVRRPTHQDIAAAIGTTRETVTRLMSELEASGLLTSEGKMTYIREETLRREGL
ncbi:MAG: Crp/Fnr family transcriptional regulator [Thermoanaerobaculum sp.]|nr:Crp/Fnr family transcriptional regulator [Thermoanaerobaculum sp.]MDW7968073.1 Crp/Fnr family transcriptional regulator [Thermoanaerobaculum sp.]